MQNYNFFRAMCGIDRALEAAPGESVNGVPSMLPAAAPLIGWMKMARNLKI